MISFDVNPGDLALIDSIAARAVELSRRFGTPRRKQDVMMDISACHANGCPLRLHALLDADDFNFGHDVFGIGRHLDRDDASPTGGQLLNMFRPRFAVKETVNG